MRRVAIIKPCCIGDAVMSLPAVDSLHAALPQAELHVWTGSHSRPVFENRSHITRIEPIPNVPARRHVPGIAWRLRRNQYDLICALDRSRLLDAACRLSGAPSLASIRGIPSESRHETDVYLAALAAVGIQASAAIPTIDFNDDQCRVADALAGQVGRPFVVLHPGGAENPGASMHSKRWPTARWADLTGWVHRRGLAVVYTGSPAEEPLCRQVAEAADATCVTVAAGRLTLLESAALIRAARAFVGPDTGLSHLSAATGTPTVAIFGPTNPDRYAPRGPAVQVVCASGSLRVPDADLRRPSEPDPSAATNRISVEDVIAALERALQSPSNPEGRM